MLPMSPIIPGRESEEIVIAKDQPEYLSLPALTIEDGFLSRWKLTWRERLQIAWSGSLYIAVLTFGMRHQPIKPMARAEDL